MRGLQPTDCLPYNSAMLDAAQRLGLFPVLADWAYLNTAFRGPVSTPAADAAKAYIDSLSTRGVTAWQDWQQAWDETHAAFATFINAERAEVQLLSNATDALTRVTLGIDWQPGDHAIAFERDYPGVVRPLLDLRRRGVYVTLVPERADGFRNVSALLQAATPRTRLIAASWIDFRTGFKLDAASLAMECRKREIFCAIDAVQAIGAMPVDVKTIGADTMTFAARKYLNGLDAVGALYIRNEAIPQITPHSRGTYSVREPFNFEAIDQPLAEGAQRYMLGAPSMPQVYALQAALKLQSEAGREAIHAATQRLADEVREQAAQAGLPSIDAAWPAEYQSHIVSIQVPDRASLASELEQAKVAASVRHGTLRVAPHWYNNEQDIQRLFAAIAV